MIAIGKASTAMAQGVIDVVGDQIVHGLVIGKAEQLEHTHAPGIELEVLTSSHPIPDERSLVAGHRLIEFIGALPAEMPLLFLISGGTSALVEVPVEGITLGDLRDMNAAMLAGGMPIEDMNRARKAVSRIKGGRLLGYLGHRKVIALMLSDVPGDDPAVIGSGLLVPEQNGSLLPENLPENIRRRLAGLLSSEAQAQHQAKVETYIIGNNAMACEGAAKHARDLGYVANIHAGLLSDDVNLVAERLTEFLKQADPGIHVWGAEPTVELPADPGRGGRNQQLALLLAKHIRNSNELQILVGATDGNDGITEDAGALVDSLSVRRGENEGMNAEQCLASASAGEFLAASGDLISTGPTGTNVMDLIIACKHDL